MAVLIVFIVLAVACVASAVLPETRDLDDRDRRGWWPGSSRR